MELYLPAQKPSERFTKSEVKRGMAVKTINNRLAVLSTLIKYSTGEKSKFRFNVAAEAHGTRRRVAIVFGPRGSGVAVSGSGAA